MDFISINPYTNQQIATYSELSEEALNQKIIKGQVAFEAWRTVSFEERAKVFIKAAEILRTKTEIYAETITLEMGKPIAEARLEVEKCAWVCEYYAENAEFFLATKTIETDAHESYVVYEPLGGVLAIMPWNFPFWQVFRFVAPTLMAGNVGLLKHAANVMGSAIHIEEILTEAGLPDGVFQNLIIGHETVEKLIANPFVKAVTLTGSERAGSAVAAVAGKNIKKSLLELGGSNAFVVLADADLDKTTDVAIAARYRNSGQSCIAGKRFVVVAEVYDAFLSLFKEKVAALKSGDPMQEGIKIGTLAKADFAINLHKQVTDSIEMGAEVIIGGTYNGAYYAPTILVNVNAKMPVFREEVFGPVAPIMKVKNAEEALNVAKDTAFGLGISIFTQDLQKVKTYISQVADASFFVNELVKSDPRLPFGGTGISGYGRELSQEGILEFVNVKTVYIKKF